jgi:hypothetical protein
VSDPSEARRVRLEHFRAASGRGAQVLRALPRCSAGACLAALLDVNAMCLRHARACAVSVACASRRSAQPPRRRKGDDDASDDGCGHAQHDGRVALCGQRADGDLGAARIAGVRCGRAPARARGARGADAAPNAAAGARAGTPRPATTRTSLTSRPPSGSAESKREPAPSLLLHAGKSGARPIARRRTLGRRPIRTFRTAMACLTLVGRQAPVDA